MSAKIDGTPCPPCERGHHGDCHPWRLAASGWTYCTCPECDDEDWDGYDPWEPTDAELEDMARRHFAEKEGT